MEIGWTTDTQDLLLMHIQVIKMTVAHNFISQDGNYSDILSTETIVVIQGALYKDRATTLPSILTVGIGDLFIFNDGKYVQGNWRRTDISEKFLSFLI